MARKVYHLSYSLFETKAQANTFAKRYNEHMLNYYMRKHHPATVSPWFSAETGQTKWIVFYPVG